MPRRQPPPAKDFAFDFTADWRPYAAIPPGSPASHGWTLCGTVTKRGRTSGLAYYAGRFAECTGEGLIFEFTALEQSRVSLAVTFKQQPGWETVPRSNVDYYGHGQPRT
jgi:hypothetical protein